MDWRDRIGSVHDLPVAEIMWTGFRIGKLLDRLRDRGRRERIAKWKAWARKADKGGHGGPPENVGGPSGQ